MAVIGRCGELVRFLALVATITALLVVVGAPPAAADSFGTATMLPLSEWTIMPNPSTYGQPVVVNGFVSDASDSCTAISHDCDWPSGDVFFSLDNCTTFFAEDDLNPPDLNGDFSSFSETFTNLPVGANQLCVKYHASPIPTVSNPHPFDDTQQTVTVNVNKAPVAVTLNDGTPDPSTFGQTVTWTGTVVPNPAVTVGATKPTGTVNLTTGSGNAASATIDAATGAFTITSSALIAGSYTNLTASYLGDTNYETGTSGAVDQTVTQASSSTTVGAAPSSSSFGQLVTFTANVLPLGASGSVQFLVDDVDAGTYTLSGGTASFTHGGYSTGSHTVAAYYLGDTSYLGSNGSSSFSVTKADTTTFVSSSPNPSVFGQPVNVNAAVSSGTSGTVTFFDGSTSIGTATLTGGDAENPQITKSNFAVGSHSLTASYGGDSNHNGSTSPAITHLVNKANTATTLTGPSGPVDFGGTAALNVSVAAVAPGAGTRTGTVTLQEGTLTRGTATLSGGTASFNVADLLPGAHSMVATYNGDGNFNGSTSNEVLVTVTCPKEPHGRRQCDARNGIDLCQRRQLHRRQDPVRSEGFYQQRLRQGKCHEQRGKPRDDLWVDSH